MVGTDLRLGIAHHLGWAVAVTASADHRVVDRRRIELVGPGLPAAPVHHHGGTHAMHRSGEPLDDGALEVLVAEVRASSTTTAGAELDALVAHLPGPIVTFSVRAWPVRMPTDIAVLRRPPHESRVDSAMYGQVLAELARDRGWAVHLYDAKGVEALAAAELGERAHQVLHDPRAELGAPWSRDHRTALAATVMAGRDGPV